MDQPAAPTPPRRARPPWAAAAALAVAAAAIAVTTWLVVERTGRVGYALDDPYIHLAIAGNLAEHGTFGIEPGTYESASSSPLWTLALAAGRATPLPELWLPLLFGVPCALAATWLLVRRAAPGDSPVTAAAVVLVPVTVGIAPLVATGMEHSAHVLAVLVVLALATGPEHRRRWALPAALAVATALRFETLFLLPGVALVLRRPGDPRGTVAAIARCAAAPLAVVGAFAAVNVAFGQGLLPNSVVAKVDVDGSLLPDLGEAWTDLLADPLLAGLLAALAAVLVLGPRTGRAAHTATIVLPAAAAHLLWAEVGWFERYQAYLVAGAMAGLLAALADRAPDRPGDASRRMVLAALLVAAAAPRAVLATQAPAAATEIHLAHEQIGRFLVAERPGEPVALLDIGYPAFLGAGPIIDVFGLADHRMLELRRQGRLDRAAVEARLDEDGAELLVAFERPFGLLVPEGWVRVEEWCVPERVLIFDECYAFFVHPDAADEVRAQLDAFGPSLPAGVDRRPSTP